MICSGGVNIEEVAEKDPDAIKKFKLPMSATNELGQELVEQIARDGLSTTLKEKKWKKLN
jgi:succinyl-CoA synthetase beta subunit